MVRPMNTADHDFGMTRSKRNAVTAAVRGKHSKVEGTLLHVTQHSSQQCNRQAVERATRLRLFGST
jgi:hypothetical protein